MKPQLYFVVIGAFLLGMLTTLVLGSGTQNPQSTTSYVVANADSIKEEDDGNIVTRVLGMTNEEQASPNDWVKENQILVEGDKVTIKIEGAQWSKFTDTNSMDPVIDEYANAIQIIPKDPSQINVGDIVSYKSEYADGTIIHRVVEIGYDEKGWYCLMKGDNNKSNDPGKVRFSQIKRVTIAVIY